MAPFIDLYTSRKIYSEIFDFNRDEIPDRLMITEQKGIIQATIEMNGYCTPTDQNKIVLFQQNQCSSEELK